MTVEDESSPPSAPKWQRMPARLRLELQAAVLEHLQEHGAHGYELLRDDRRFVAWTGTHLGHRGEKYFDREVACARDLQAHRARLKRRRMAGPDAPVARSPETAAPDAGRPDGPLATATPSFSDLLGDLRDQRRTITAEQAACLDNDGAIADEKRFYRATRELREINKAIADLSKQYGALKSGEVADALLRLLQSEFGDQPDRVRAVIANFNDLILQQSGLAARSGDT